MYIFIAYNEILRISKGLCLLGVSDNSLLTIIFVFLLSKTVRKKHETTTNVSENWFSAVGFETKLLISCNGKEQISAEKFCKRW